MQQAALGCNRQCGDKTGRAALRWPRHAGVRACAQQRLPHWKRRVVVGNARQSLNAKPNHTKARVRLRLCVWLCGCVCVCVHAWMCVCVCVCVCVCLRACVPSECENALLNVRACACVRACVRARLCARESALRE